jgi:hypothetical protein
VSADAPDPPDEQGELWYLGGPGEDAPDAGQVESARRTRRVALIGLATVVLVAAVAITLAALVDTSGLTSPANPRAAAERWGRALIHGDSGSRHKLECSGSQSGDVAALVLVSSSSVRVVSVQPAGRDRWSVPLEVRGPNGDVQDTLPLTVVRRSGRYLVC